MSQVLFERNSPYPTTKAITLMRAEPFTLEAYYPDQPQLPAGAERQLGKYTIGPFQVGARELSTPRVPVHLPEQPGLLHMAVLLGSHSSACVQPLLT